MAVKLNLSDYIVDESSILENIDYIVLGETTYSEVLDSIEFFFVEEFNAKVRSETSQIVLFSTNDFIFEWFVTDETMAIESVGEELMEVEINPNNDNLQGEISYYFQLTNDNLKTTEFDNGDIFKIIGISLLIVVVVAVIAIIVKKVIS